MTARHLALLEELRQSLRGAPPRPGFRRVTSHLGPRIRRQMAAVLLDEGGYPWDVVAWRLGFPSADRMVDVVRHHRLAVVAGGGSAATQPGRASAPQSTLSCAPLAATTPTDRSTP